MKRSPRRYAQALLTVVGDAPVSRRPALLKGFLRFLRRRRQWKQLPRIVTAVAEERRRQSGVVRVLAETARPLPATYASTLARRLGRPVELETRVDASLIGGLRLTVDGQRLDATVPAVLAQLRRRLGGQVT